MKAVVFLAQGKIETQELGQPVPGDDEVLVKVTACGVCGTDVHNLSWPYHRGHPTAGGSRSRNHRRYRRGGRQGEPVPAWPEGMR